MTQRDYSFLSEHFNFETFELTPEHRFTKEIKKGIEDDGCTESHERNDMKYSCVFKEIASDEILFSSQSPRPIKIDTALKGFCFYLKQLPSLSLADVAMFFALEWENNNLYENIFKIDENYPSPFAAELLKETYGKVIFSNQFTTLLAACLPAIANSHKGRDEYRWAMSLSLIDRIKKFETMFLPDAVNLNEFLLKYTVNKHNGSDRYGFLVPPIHKLAFDFITRAKKYV